MSKSKVLAWAWMFVVGLLIAHNAYLWLGRHVVPDTDILALLPVQDRDPVLQQAFTHMVDSAQQRLIVLVGAERWDDASRAADAYRKVLAQHADLFQFTDSVVDQTERDWLALFQQHRLTLMTAQNEAALRGQPQQYWVETAMGKLYSPFDGLKLGAWRDDPFGLFGDWVQARARETPVRPRDGRLFVSDGRRQYVVMPLTLRVPAFSMAGQQAVMPLLEQARQSAKTAVPQIEILTAGVILHAAAASEQARQEMSTIGIGSAIGILALMWLSFYSFKPIALILLSIGIGCLGALSVCWLLFDRIHLLTLVFGASLIGVAEDYGIYFLCNRVGADAQLDSRQLLRRLLPGLVLTVITTLAAYASLLADAISGVKADGGVFHTRVGVRLADRSFVVSHVGSLRLHSAHAARAAVRRQSVALAVVAPQSSDIRGDRLIHRYDCVWPLATERQRRHSFVAESAEKFARRPDQNKQIARRSHAGAVLHRPGFDA